MIDCRDLGQGLLPSRPARPAAETLAMGICWGDRPYAHLVVFEKDDGWWVRVADREAGPSPSKHRAIVAAFEYAQSAERQGKSAPIEVQTRRADFETLWPKA
jgi:hypothetical protein